MKQELYVLPFLLFFLYPLKIFAEVNPWEIRLPFKLATINYELSGMENGKEDLYIRAYGKEMVRYRTSISKVFGMAMQKETIEITTPNWIYSFDLKEVTGRKSINPRKIMIEQYNKLSEADKQKVIKNAGKMAQSAIAGMQGQWSNEPNAIKILGFSCDLAANNNNIVYSIHETPIALLVESNIMGMQMNSVATNIKAGSVDNRKFEFPKGIVPQPDPQGDKMARVIAFQTIEALKDPESVAANKRTRAPLQLSRQGEHAPVE